MLSVEDWAEIRRLRRSERLPISEIARVLKISRNTVKSALASDGPPKYQRAAKGSVADEAEPRIRELLAAYPRMPATVIAERIGWWYSIRTLSGRVRELRPLYLPPDPASRDICGRRDRAVRLLVPRCRCAGGVRPGPHRHGVTCADHGVWVFAVGLGAVDPDTHRRRLVCRVVAASFDVGRRSKGVGVGRRGRGRAVVGAPT